MFATHSAEWLTALSVMAGAVSTTPAEGIQVHHSRGAEPSVPEARSTLSQDSIRRTLALDCPDWIGERGWGAVELAWALGLAPHDRISLHSIVDERASCRATALSAAESQAAAGGLPTDHDMVNLESVKRQLRAQEAYREACEKCDEQMLRSLERSIDPSGPSRHSSEALAAFFARRRFLAPPPHGFLVAPVVDLELVAARLADGGDSGPFSALRVRLFSPPPVSNGHSEDRRAVLLAWVQRVDVASEELNQLRLTRVPQVLRSTTMEELSRGLASFKAELKRRRGAWPRDAFDTGSRIEGLLESAEARHAWMQSVHRSIVPRLLRASTAEALGARLLASPEVTGDVRDRIDAIVRDMNTIMLDAERTMTSQLVRLDPSRDLMSVIHQPDGTIQKQHARRHAASEAAITQMLDALPPALRESHASWVASALSARGGDLLPDP
ncbi:MAG: hypothetical protein KF724_00875 [Phycisphaeraceae bacterium]|nr:hypothetical protein [Phycisphaeraceae bacterium]